MSTQPGHTRIIDDKKAIDTSVAATMVGFDSCRSLVSNMLTNFKAAKHATAIVLKKTAKPQKPWLHDIVLETRPVPKLRPGQILVRMNAVALNHRDVSRRIIESDSAHALFSYGFVKGSTLELPLILF